MKFVWVDAGNGADFDKLARHEIDGEFYAATDPVSDLARRLKDSRSRRHAGGLYTAWNWLDDLNDGEAYAEWTHELVTKIERELRIAGLPPSPSFPKVQLDNENHDMNVILRMLRRWRKLRPKQDTSWTLEAGQGGLMTPAFVSEVVSLRVRIVPQLYNGAMTVHFDSLEFARDLTSRGFPDGLISPFHDAAALPHGWQGFAFTQGRLP